GQPMKNEQLPSASAGGPKRRTKSIGGFCLAADAGAKAPRIESALNCSPAASAAGEQCLLLH
ncbi:MAG: hypothetical protein LBF90_01085, partial [Prevotellaceae bacterium]|nr:hypothetical protein [Prevotellaceae bacterium]